MIKWMLKYRGRPLCPLLFSSKEKAEDFAMIGFENILENLTFVAGTRYQKHQKRYEKELDRYFDYEIVKCRIKEVK